MRTADGFGVTHIHCCGYTPYPDIGDDSRLPHIIRKTSALIDKTALGAQKHLNIQHHGTTSECIAVLRDKGITVFGLEQDPRSVRLDTSISITSHAALIVGEEVSGLPEDIRAACDVLFEIPMHGKKESFNVSVATGIALYALNQSCYNDAKSQRK